MKRLDMNYEQVARLNKRQSTVLGAIGAIMIALALFGLIVNASGTRQTLSTRKTLLGGLSKQVALLDNDETLTAMGQDITAGFETIAAQVSAAKQQSLSNQRDQLTPGRKYDSLTSQMAEYDTELADHIYMAEVSLHDMGMAEWEYKTLVITDREELRALMQAVKADADAGDLAQSFIFHRYENQNGWIMLSTDNQAITHYNYDITFYPSSQHLTAFIREYLAEQQQTQ